jgi:hypothetical protein
VATEDQKNRYTGTESVPTIDFCVYNSSPVTIEAIQWGGGRDFKDFRATIHPGKRACCNYKNKDCNRSGKKDGLVRMRIRLRLGHERTVVGLSDGRTARTSTLWCGPQDNAKDKYRTVHMHGWGAIDVHYHGPLDGGRLPWTVQRNDFRVYSWTHDGKLRSRELCETNEKGWTPDDLF